jgi:quercetin dioxygenase-like cupin family protein
MEPSHPSAEANVPHETLAAEQETDRAALFVDGFDDGWTDLGAGVRRRVRLHLPQMMMVEAQFARNAVGATHSHPHVQCCYVKKGAFDVTIAGTSRRVSEGGAFIVPANVLHGVVAVEAGILVDVFTPRREDFIET